MPKDGGLGLIDVATQADILSAKWVVRCLDSTSPWQILFQRKFETTQHAGKVWGGGGFILCDIVSSSHQYKVFRFVYL